MFPPPPRSYAFCPGHELPIPLLHNPTYCPSLFCLPFYRSFSSPRYFTVVVIFCRNYPLFQLHLRRSFGHRTKRPPSLYALFFYPASFGPLFRHIFFPNCPVFSRPPSFRCAAVLKAFLVESQPCFSGNPSPSTFNCSTYHRMTRPASVCPPFFHRRSTQDHLLQQNYFLCVIRPSPYIANDLVVPLVSQLFKNHCENRCLPLASVFSQIFSAMLLLFSEQLCLPHPPISNSLPCAST